MQQIQQIQQIQHRYSSEQQRYSSRKCIFLCNIFVMGVTDCTADTVYRRDSESWLEAVGGRLGVWLGADVLHGGVAE
eukprot:1203298-Prymnesium_polylepis.1